MVLSSFTDALPMAVEAGTAKAVNVVLMGVVAKHMEFTKEAWEKLSTYVEYMHIKDALENGHVVPAGKGIGNLPYLLSKYKGEVLTLEPHLSVFSGFEKLEGNQKTQIDEYSYPSSRAAFDAAVNALKELLGGKYEKN